MMVPEMEKPRVTEIKVRMDCNGCVQKIKKALNGITDIYDIYINFPQQKIKIIGWADPEKIVKAIKKTRKSAVICLNTEPQPDQPAQPPEPMPEGGAPPPEPTSPTHELTQTETSPPPEPPKEQPQPENPPPPESNTSPVIVNATSSQSGQHPYKPNVHEENHVIHHHPPNYGYRYAYGPNFQQGDNGQWNSYNGGPQFRDRPPQPIYVTHRYNTYKPSPYVTEYAYPRSPPRYSLYNVPDNYTSYSVPDYKTSYSMPDYNTRYSTPDYYSRDYYSGNNGNGNITSMFSEENPNACRIV